MIRLLADENIPLRAIESLVQRGIDITSVVDLSPGLSDREVIKIANRENRVIITFDKEFGKLIFKENLKVRGLILLRFRAFSPDQIADRLVHILDAQIPVHDRIIVAGEERIRVTSLR